MEWQTHRDNHMRGDRPLTSALVLLLARSLHLSLRHTHTHFQEGVINVREKNKSSHGFKMEYLLIEMQSFLTGLSQAEENSTKKLLIPPFRRQNTSFYH